MMVPVSTVPSQGYLCLGPQLRILAVVRSHAIYPPGQGPVLPSFSLSPECVRMDPKHTTASETELHPLPPGGCGIGNLSSSDTYRVESHLLFKDIPVFREMHSLPSTLFIFHRNTPNCSSSSKNWPQILFSAESPRGDP